MPAMTAPRVWKRGFVSLGAVVLVVLGAGVARADVAFRKKPPAATDSSSLEGAPNGGDTADAPATEAAPADGTADKGSYAPQAEDKDTPEAQALRDKQRADAALARKARNEQLARDRERGTPFYEKWQFWAITGGVVVGGLLAFFAGKAVFHDANGGDVRACPMGDTGGCFGEGR
jgi:hypothetical protein